MLALVKTEKGVGKLELKNVPIPSPKNNEVKIEIKACGICGTDIHVMHDSFPYYPPVILGHEFAGEVVELGPECKTINIGDRVVAEPHNRACGVCSVCRKGHIQICPEKRSPGWGMDGGMTKYICYPEHLLHTIPEHMTWEQAALVEPFANIVTDLLMKTRIVPGDFVVVQGPGAIGLLAAMAARAAGARDVAILATEKDLPIRVKKANELGFNNIVNVNMQNPVEAVMAQTKGCGADVVVECSGAPRAISILPDLVRKMGRICVVGLTGNKQVTIDWDKLMFKVAQVNFNLSTEYDSWDRAIAMIAGGNLPVEKLITHRSDLHHWEETFTAITNLEAIKGIIIP